MGEEHTIDQKMGWTRTTDEEHTRDEVSIKEGWLKQGPFSVTAWKSIEIVFVMNR